MSVTVSVGDRQEQRSLVAYKQPTNGNSSNVNGGLNRQNWPGVWTDDSAQLSSTASPLKSTTIHFPFHSDIAANPTYNWLPAMNGHQSLFATQSQPQHTHNPILGLHRMSTSPLPPKEENNNENCPPGTSSSINTAEDGPTPTRSTTTDLNRLLIGRGSKCGQSVLHATPITSEQVYCGLSSLMVVGVGSAILAILCVQVLLGLHNHAFAYAAASTQLVASGDDMLVPSPKSTRYLLSDIASTLCMISLSFSMCAQFTATFQLFLALKMLKMSADSHMQIMRYLREGLLLRFIAFFGFFISIPLFLLAVLALMLSTSGSVGGSSASIGIFVVISLAAFTICLAIMAHGAYAWISGSLKMPEFKENGKPQKNLSTLV